MDDGDNGQLIDMDSSDQQTSQIDSEMDSQQSSSQDYQLHLHHDILERPTELGTHNSNKKRQSTESNSSSVVGKYWRSKSLPVAYLPPLGQPSDATNLPDNSPTSNTTSGGSLKNKSQSKDQSGSSKRGTSCRNCGGGSTKRNNTSSGGAGAAGGVGVGSGGKCGRCCRGSGASANSHESCNNGKVKSLGGGSSAEQESGEVKKKSDWRTLQQHYYPEGGWGWIVTFCALSSHALALGVQLYLSTVVFQHFQKGWLGSVSMAVSMFLSPLWVSICKRKSTRLSAVFGGLVAALGCLFTSFATKFHQVFISYGFFIGVGVGLTRDASTLMVGQYFKRKREIVEIVVVAGSGLGILLMSIAVHMAISSLGWRLGLQAITGTIFITFFLGTCYRSASLYHPQRRAILHLKNQKRKVWTQPKNMKEKEKREDKPPFLDFSCLRSKTLQILLLSTSFTSFGINTPLFNLVIECSGEGVDRFSLVLLHIYVGLAWMVGCFLFGLIVIQKNQECRVSKQYLCQMASVVCGISIVALTAVEGFGGLVIFSWVYGFSLGGYNYALKVYTYERVRARHFPRAWSFVQCSQSIPVACGVALSGYINSTVGWKIGYYLAAVTVFLGTSFLFLTDVRRRRLSRRKTNNSSMKTNETTETVQSPKARKISFSFPVEPIPAQSKHDSEGQIAGIDPSILAKELTCISEEGLIDMDFQDIYFEEWADYFGDCITSCNKVENCLHSEYDPEYAVLIERRARRWSAARPSFAQTAHAGIGATAAALASGVVGVGTSNGANGGTTSNGANNGTASSSNNGSTVASASSSHHHHHLLAPGSFHIIPAQLSHLSQLVQHQSLDGATAPLASSELADDPSPNASANNSDGQNLGPIGAIREIPLFRPHQHPPRSGRRSTVEPPSRSITVIDEASV